MRVFFIILSLFSLSSCSNNTSFDSPLSLVAKHNTVDVSWVSNSEIKQDFDFSLKSSVDGKGFKFEKISGPDWAYVNPNTGQITGNVKDLNGVVRIYVYNSEKKGVFDVPIIGQGDPLKSEQWYLKNTGQKAFSQKPGTTDSDINLSDLIVAGYTGQGVRIAVSDTGLQTTHPDLSENLLPNEHRNYSLSGSIFSGDPLPDLTDASNAHGTAVSGIISAVGWNGIGIRGVAPRAKIAGFKYIGTGAGLSSIKRNDQATGNFDIFNYSYGVSQEYFSTIQYDYVETLKAGVTIGRSSKGKIYVKSAGNDFVGLFSDPNSNYYSTKPYFFGNANFDQSNVFPYIIIVGANSSEDKSSSYSSPGSNLWVSAPGGEDGNELPAIVTTDFVGCARGLSNSNSKVNSFESGKSSLNSNCDYTSSMNGTSSAAPIISGVVALMLQANPKLTWRDVKHILAVTSRKIDPNIKVNGHPIGSSADLPGFNYQDAWITNGAGFKFHNYFGFGAIDTKSALTMAKNYISTLSEFKSTDSSLSSWLYSNLNPINIPDKSSVGASSSISLNHNYTVEAIQVRVNVTHPWSGQLGIELTSPSGTKSQLMNINSFIDASSLNDVVFLSNAFYGENSLGSWTLKVIDGMSGGIGRLDSWDIRVFGHLPNTNDKTPPLSVTSITHAGSYNSSNQSPSVSWTASSSTDVIRYEYSIGTSPGSTNFKNWTSVGLGTSVTAVGLSLVLNGQYFINVRAIDSSENVSSVASSTGWFYTNSAAPVLSIGTPDKNKANSSSTVSFPISFSGASNVYLDNTKVTLNPSLGVNCNVSITGSGLLTRNVLLTSCTGNGTISLNVLAGAITNQFNVQSIAVGPSSLVTIDNLAPTISGLTSSNSPTQTKTWSWTCSENPCDYRYVIDQTSNTMPSGAYLLTSSASKSNATGTFYIHVQARDSVGNESTVTHVYAVLENSAPTITGLDNDSVWKKNKTWIWGCSKASCAYRYVIDTSPNSSPSGSFNSTSSATISSGTGTYYLHVQALDSIGNQSAVAHYSALIDNTVPTTPSISLSSSAIASISSSPIVSISNNADVHSGIQKNQSRIIKTSDNTIVSDWKDINSEGFVSNLNLTTNTSYQFQIRSIDNVGNISASGLATWLADVTPPTNPTGITLGTKPRSLNKTPTLSWSGCSDSGGIGGVYTNVKLIKSSNQTAIIDYGDLANGALIDNLSLDDYSDYFFKIKCLDSLGNTTADFSSATFKTNNVKFTKACAGKTVKCGINSNGALKCWGGVFPTIPTLQNGFETSVTDVACNDDKVFAVKNGILYSLNGLVLPSSMPSSVTSISYSLRGAGLNTYNACVVASDNLWCWGDNVVGQLGNGTTISSNIPVQVQGISSPLKVSVSKYNTCAKVLSSTSSIIKCWGLRFGYFGMDSSCNYGYSPFSRDAPFTEDSKGSFCSSNYGYFLFYAKYPQNLSTYGGYDVSLAGLGGVIANTSGTYAWGAESVADKIPNQGWFTQTYDNSQPVEIVMNADGKKCLHLSNGTTKCWAFGLNGFNSTYQACDEPLQKLLSPEYFLSTAGFIRKIDDCSGVSN